MADQFDPLDEVRLKLGLDRVLAHQVLFAHRHRDKTPAFHKIMIADWHGPEPAVQTMAFRGGAKSTIAEEAITIMACYREFKNGIILGETFERANERLGAIAHEIETNDMLAEVFGNMKGSRWSLADGEIVLVNDTRIKAMGRGEAIRGIKFYDMRPDMLFVDDLEDEDSVSTPAKRKKTKIWFTKVLVPACDKRVKIRVASTPLHPEALAMDLKRDPFFVTRVFPIEYIGDDGERAATWPGRYSLAEIDRVMARFLSRGLRREYEMEYMCKESTETDQTFKSALIRAEPRARTWEAVYGMLDPARTTHETSATTGFAAWSWSPKLLVWESWARRIMPDEQVAALFDFCERFDPVWACVEEDGLNEFLLQPIRAEMVRRGRAIPLKSVKAPRGKYAFIRGLQPFFAAKEVIFVGSEDNHTDLIRQLKAFPLGDIDAPNALAYALRLRGGVPVYDGFGSRHINPEIRAAPGLPIWLAMNAEGALTTGALCQMVDGCVRVLADYVREGDAGAQLLMMVQAAQLDAGRGVRLVAGPQHFDRFNNVGLVQAAKRLPMEVRQGVAPVRGRGVLRTALQRETRAGQGLQVSAEARWTLNGFSSGFAYDLDKRGTVNPEPASTAYKVLLEGLEALVGLMEVRQDEDDERDNLNYAYTSDGRRYVSALARRG